MSFYKRRRPKPEEEKCADPAKARARALDALASREMSSAQLYERCLLYTSPSPRDGLLSRMPSSA